MRGTVVRGISPQDEAGVTDLAARLKDTLLAKRVPGEWRIALGYELACATATR